MTDFGVELRAGRALYIPSPYMIHRQQPVGYCAVPVNGDGDVCGHPSFTEEERRRHAVDCATRNASAIHAYRKRSHPDIMRPWDPELEEFVRARAADILADRQPMPRG